MPTLIFQGGTADWFAAGSWSPNVVPQAGDSMTIASGAATISAADVINFGILNNEQLAIGSASSATPAVFSADGASFGNGFTVKDMSSGFAELNFSGSVTYAGNIDLATEGGLVTLGITADATNQAAFNLTGTTSIENGDNLTINGGTLADNGNIVVTDATLTIGAASSVQGTGTITVGDGATVVIDGPVSPGVTIDFTGTTGVLDLVDPLNFNGSVSGFVKGDVIDLINAPSYLWGYNTKTDVLAVYGSNATQRSSNPSVASFVLTSNTTLTTQQIFVGQDGNGGSLIQLADIRTWNGGNGEWYSTNNWTTAGTLAANSYPLFGDTAIIASGVATISANDFVTYGELNNETVQLSGNGAGLLATSGTLGADLTISSIASQSTTSLGFDGTTTSDAVIRATGPNATLQFNIGTLGAHAGDFVNDVSSTISVSTESALEIAAGRLTNNGQIVISGQATIEDGATVDGTGAINFQASRITLTVAGSVAATQAVSFHNDTLNIAPGALFNGNIQNFANRDTIDLQGVIANYASFDASDDVLTLRQNGPSGTIVGTLNIAGDYGATDFAVASDGNGGTFITDTVAAGVQTIYETLPVPAIAAAGTPIPLTQLLTEAFGTNFLATNPTLQLWSPSEADLQSFSYWDPSQPALPYWTVNGTEVPPDTYLTVLPSQLGSVNYVSGNLIEAGAIVQLSVSFSSGQATTYLDYEIQNFESQFAQPSLTSGAPTPQDVVNAASAFAAAYTDVPNTEDCWNIACEVGSAAGATMPNNSYSTDPQQNVAGGFWRIAYAAPQNDTAVVNWSPLVEAGDILRIGWEGGGAHSFTIIDPVNDAGLITVFDNIYYASQTGFQTPTSYEAIGIHTAEYWSSNDPDGTTNPEDITIYRLDPNSLYLVDLTTSNGTLIQNLSSAIVQGTTNNDIVIPYGSAGVITGGGGNDVFADASTILNGATITDFHGGDTIDLTDLNSAITSVEYDPTTGILDVISNGDTVADIQLPDGLAGTFEINNDGGTTGLDGNTLGTLYASLFVGPTPDGTAITLVTCFAAGTRIATPRGEVAVEDLSVGDMVLCADGRTQKITWIGQRQLDIARQPQPDKVLPIRILPGAFGEGLPTRSLLLSPDHAVFAEGVLIPIRYLVNGSTIAQLPASAMASVTYYHIELPLHDVVLAERLPVESYLDTGTRSRFANGGPPIALFPDFASRIWEAKGCAPLRIVGPEVDAVRRRLQRFCHVSRRSQRIARSEGPCNAGASSARAPGRAPNQQPAPFRRHGRAYPGHLSQRQCR